MLRGRRLCFWVLPGRDPSFLRGTGVPDKGRSLREFECRLLRACAGSLLHSGRHRETVILSAYFPVRIFLDPFFIFPAGIYNGVNDSFCVHTLHIIARLYKQISRFEGKEIWEAISESGRSCSFCGNNTSVRATAGNYMDLSSRTITIWY